MKNQRPIKNEATCLTLIALFLVVPLWGAAHAAAPAYPNKPISIVVPMAAGGTTDLQARVLAEAMEKELKQPVVVVNKPGGAMTVGGYTVASAKPDGYMLGYFPLVTQVPELFNFIHVAPYTSDDLRTISRVGTPLMVIVVKGDAPWNSLKELLEYARKNPRAVKYGHPGRGGTGHTVMSAIAKQENIELVDVPYDGDAALNPAILGGHIGVGVPAYPATKSLIAARSLKALAMCTEKRAPFAPDIPSVVELGYKLPYITYLALCAPKRTPDDVVKKLDEAVRKIAEDKNFLDRNKPFDSLVTYEDTATFEKTLARYKTDLQAFFKEQGLIK